MTTFYLIRHGDAQKNELGKYNYDPSLTDLGRMQAQQLSKDLANVKFDYFFASTKTRAIQTALFFTNHQQEISCSPDFSEATGLKSDTNRDSLSTLEENQDFLATPEEKKFDFTPLDGSESVSSVYHRFSKKLLDLSLQYPSQTIAIFSHSMSLKILLANYGYIKFSNLATTYLSNCGFVILEVQARNYNIKEVVGLIQ